MSDASIPLRLSPAEALVLFEFLSRHSRGGGVEIGHLAEERVLRVLCCQLERALPDPDRFDYRAMLLAARQSLMNGSANLIMANLEASQDGK